MTGWCAAVTAAGVWYGVVFEWAAGVWFDRDPYSRIVDVFLILSSQAASFAVVFGIMCCWHARLWWQQSLRLRRSRPRSFAGDRPTRRRVPSAR